MTYRIRNWDKWQHYSEKRRVVWVKLYTSLLETPEWFELSGDDAKTLIGLILLASEKKGELPDLKTTAFRLRINTTELTKSIQCLDGWLEKDENPNKSAIASNLLATCYQPASLEERRDRDREEIEREERREDKLTTPKVLSSKRRAETRPKPSDFETELLEEWNAACKISGIPCVRPPLSPGRARHLRARMAESEWMEHWKDGLHQLHKSDFCKGLNKRNWRADIDFFLRPDTVAKTLEGKYDQRKLAVPDEVEGISF